jgi:hypothetical protein
MHLGKTLHFTKHSKLTFGWHNFVDRYPEIKYRDQPRLKMPKQWPFKKGALITPEKSTMRFQNTGKFPLSHNVKQ